MGRPRSYPRLWQTASRASSKKQGKAAGKGASAQPSEGNENSTSKKRPRRFSTGNVRPQVDAEERSRSPPSWEERRRPRADSPTRNTKNCQAPHKRPQNGTEDPVSPNLSRFWKMVAAETVEIGKSCDGMALANDRNGVRSVSPTRAERHRATWPGPKGGRPELFVGDGAPIGDDPGSPEGTTIPPSLLLKWEIQGVSGRAYQRDGNLALYRKKKIAARRRLSKNADIRDTIEWLWWPYLPLRWMVLNDSDVLEIFPRQRYKRLLESMYTTLVPTAVGNEAEEAAAWDYAEDSKGLPSALAEIGITLGAFSDALFAVADNWTETVRAKDYVDFLRVLWKRVRPDRLFPIKPRSSNDPESSPSRSTRRQQRRGDTRRRRHRRSDHDLAPDKVERAASGTAGASRPGSTGATHKRRAPTRRGKLFLTLPSTGNIAGILDGDGVFVLPPPPDPIPPPRTPQGLESVQIPGFRPKEARRAAWVGRAELALDDTAEVIAGSGTVNGTDSAAAAEVENLESKARRRRSLMAASGSEASPNRQGEGAKGTSGDSDEEGVECLWDFTARSFPLDPREGNAFFLFVERVHPDIFTGREGDANSPNQNRAARSAGTRQEVAVVRRYCSEAATWAKMRRDVPARELEDLLALWKKGEGFSPAEYGAFRVGPTECAGFLRYAIANGWGARGGGVHSRQVLDRVAKQWKTGAGRCPEMLVLQDLVEEIIWEETDEIVEDAFHDRVDLYSIPHRLLYDFGDEAMRRSHSTSRASTAPASLSSQTRGHAEKYNRPREGGHSGSVDLMERGDFTNRRGVLDDGSAGRVLLQGERTSASVAKGQAIFFECACPLERGACLEISLQAEGTGGLCDSSSMNAFALSLYAVHARTRPPRLSSYSWVSRGKTCHRLLLNWKGPTSPPWPGEDGDRTNTPPPPVATPMASLKSNSSSPVPVHIAVVCPEPAPPSAPAFDIAIGTSTNGERGDDDRMRDTERGGRVGPRTYRMQNGGGTGVARRGRVKFSIGVRVIGPPRIVLEGRWYSLPWGNYVGLEKQSEHMSIYTTLRLPTPLKVTRWGPGSRVGSFSSDDDCDEDDDDVGIADGMLGDRRAGARDSPRFVDAQVLVTLQLRPSDPTEKVDVYCDTSPRPGPNPTEHTWWMSAGGARPDAQQTPPNPSCTAAASSTPGPGPSPAVKARPHQIDDDGSTLHDFQATAPSPTGQDQTPSSSSKMPTPLSTNDFVGSSTSNDRKPTLATPSSPELVTFTPPNHLTEKRVASGSGAHGDKNARDNASGKRGEGEHIQGVPRQCRAPAPPWVTSSALTSRDDGRWAPLAGRGAEHIGGAGWSRMTVAMPTDHGGAFHVGVFGADCGQLAKRRRGGAIDIKAAVWCPAVTIPSRVPLSGHLPRGQHRELLWTIGRSAPCFEGRVEVTRAIEDPLVLRQLEFALDFERKFGGFGNDKEHVPALGSGHECQAVHSRPFLLATRRVSPSNKEYTWRGVNTEGTLEVVTPRDGAGGVFTRYTETLKVGPKDGGYGIGRYRLVLEAGSTDCSFRVLFWNRSATAQDREISSRPLPIPGPASLRTIAIARWEAACPGRKHAQGLGGGEGQHRQRQVNSSNSPPTTSRSAPISTYLTMPRPARQHCGRKAQEFMPTRGTDEEMATVHAGNCHKSVATGFELVSSTPAPTTVPTTKGNDTQHMLRRHALSDQNGQQSSSAPFMVTAPDVKEQRPATADAGSILATESMTRGCGRAVTIATQASKRQRRAAKPAGCRRHLEIATQYLNYSQFSPTPPKSGVARPATAVEGTVNHRGFAPGHGCGGSGRPKTTGTSRVRRPQAHDPATRQSLSSAIHGCHTVLFSSRLLSAVSASGANPSRGAVTQLRQRQRPPIFVSSPPVEIGRFEHARRTESSFGPDSDKHRVEGIDCVGEFSYMVSSPVRTTEEGGGGGSLTIETHGITPRDTILVSPPSRRHEAAAAVVPKVPKLAIDRVEQAVPAPLPRRCYDGQSIASYRSPQTDHPRQQRNQVRLWRRPHSAPPLRCVRSHSPSSCSRHVIISAANVTREVDSSFDDIQISKVVGRVKDRSPESLCNGLRCASRSASIYDDHVSKRPDSAGADRPRSDVHGKGVQCQVADLKGLVFCQRDPRPGHKDTQGFTKDTAGRPFCCRNSAKETEWVGPRSGPHGQDGLIGGTLYHAPAAGVEVDPPTLALPCPRPARPSSARPKETGMRGVGEDYGVSPREFDAWMGSVAARGEKWMLPTKEEVVRWGKDIDRMLRHKATVKEGVMVTVNGQERFVDDRVAEKSV